MLGRVIPKWWPSRGFLAGLALSAPFVANPYPTSVAVLLLLPLLFDLVLRGIHFRQLFTWQPIHFVIAALATLHLVALAMNTTPFFTETFIFLVWSGGVVGISLLASYSDDRPDDIVWGLFAALAATSVPIAAAGLAKYGLQQHGILFGSMINSCFGRYPQGTTFCGDYNLFGLYLGGAAIGISAFILCTKGRPFLLAVLLVSLSIVLAAGFFAGSRRFLALAALVALFWATHAFVSPKRVAYTAILPAFLLAAMYGYFSAPRDKVADENTVTIEQMVAGALGLPAQPSPMEIAASRQPPRGTSGPMSTDEKGHPRVLAARDVSPTALASTLEDDMGFASRVEKWSLGWDMVKQNGYFWGQGFNYHRVFSCRFVDCEYIDYPHAPILSAWIGFGVLGLVLSFAFYAITGINILLAGRIGLLSGVSFFALGVMPYSLISGDTIFSLPHAVIAAVLASIIVAQKKKNKRNA
ncbi:hypothetical protein ASC97_29160 [Rhizobium sp. Root1203]|uniref:O-antigen ligase family protein n=1 Tax=Rhizobium sp. Root1203 TaxID=1736427 RepID=UPI00071079D8|nr:O-antigen ligase family protein [Rhizobium sp. Root1203]KQV19472.1 hypothetical protein ASC97_29160 [Rhizobium sp. Root1203]